jgi:hypothetical protein
VGQLRVFSTALFLCALYDATLKSITPKGFEFLLVIARNIGNRPHGIMRHPSECREQTTLVYTPPLGTSGTDRMNLHVNTRTARKRPNGFIRHHSECPEESTWIYTPSLGMSGTCNTDLYGTARNVRKTHHRFTRDCEGCPARYFKNQIFHEPCPLRWHQVLECCEGCTADYHHILIIAKSRFATLC